MDFLKQQLTFGILTAVAVAGILAPFHLGLSPGDTFGINVAHAQVGAAISSAAGALGQALGWAGQLIGGAALWAIKPLVAGIMNLILSLSGLFTWFGGIALNYAFIITIFEMSAWVNSPSQTIQFAWTVLRDIANVGLIFGLLAIGIATILRIQTYNARTLLAKLIVVALVINFSFYITGAFISLGNGVASLAWNQLTTYAGSCPNRTTGALSSVSTADACISDRFMEALRLQTIFRVDSSAAARQGTDIITSSMDWSTIIFVGLFGSLFLIITGFVFLAGAVLLCIRFVLLLFLMIISPLAWMAYVLPATSGMAKKWWSMLWREVIFAPAFILLIFISLQVAQNVPRTGSYYDLLSNGLTQSVSLVIYFAIVIGFIITSMIAAKKIGSFGSDAVVGYTQKWMHGARKWGQGVLGRNTVGWASNKASNLYGNVAARAETKGSMAFKAMRATGLDRAIKEGFEKGTKAKFGSRDSFESAEKYSTERTRELRNRNTEIQREQKIAAAIQLAPGETAPTTAPGATPHAAADYEKTVRDMSVKDLENLDSKQLQHHNIVANLTPSQLEALAKSEKVSPQDLEKIKAARVPALKAKIQKQGASSILKNPTETSSLPADILTSREVMDLLSPADLSAILRAGKLSQAQRDKISIHITSNAGVPGSSTALNKSAAWLSTPAGSAF